MPVSENPEDLNIAFNGYSLISFLNRNESMRVLPPFLSGIVRETSEGGRMVGEGRSVGAEEDRERRRGPRRDRVGFGRWPQLSTQPPATCEVYDRSSSLHRLHRRDGRDGQRRWKGVSGTYR